jgi:Ca2+/H+ antiporter, TMEM165/GDT1 family
MDWTSAMPAISAAFLASFVEVVEAFTIVLAVGTVRGWRPALSGAGAALAVLALLVVTLGPLFSLVPIHGLQLVLGVLMLMFGMRWLRKAILRQAGVIALHDEDKIYGEETAHLKDEIAAQAKAGDWIAASSAFKAVLLEGVEVVFIVLAVGAGHGLIFAASLGALAAVALVALIGVAVHKPLTRVPENTLKYAVGVMLSAFGTFWTLEGLGGSWPGADLAILALGVGYLLAGLAIGRWIAAPRVATAGAAS